MITITTVTPTRKQRTTEVRKIREAGQIVAFTLADNTGMTRLEATRYGMHAEKTGSVIAGGYTFTITR